MSVVVNPATGYGRIFLWDDERWCGEWGRGGAKASSFDVDLEVSVPRLSMAMRHGVSSLVVSLGGVEEFDVVSDRRVVG